MVELLDSHVEQGSSGFNQLGAVVLLVVEEHLRCLVRRIAGFGQVFLFVTFVLVQKRVEHAIHFEESGESGVAQQLFGLDLLELLPYHLDVFGAHLEVLCHQKILTLQPSHFILLLKFESLKFFHLVFDRFPCVFI